MIPTLSSNTTWVNPHTGKEQPVTLLNNAATTPPFAKTLQTLVNAMKTYGALHRGAGPHASATYETWMRSIGTIRTFLNMRESDALFFTLNTSSAINLFARMFHLGADDVVITSSIEHTSNNLPWRYN